MVLQGGPGGTERWVAGCRQGEAPAGLEPGEVYLYGGNGASVYLKNNGTVELKGRISIEGQLIVNGEPYRPCYCGG